MLTLCTKNLYFTLNNAIYVQNDGVAMCSPIGPILANASMVTWKHKGSQVVSANEEMETVCRWHLCLN